MGERELREKYGGKLAKAINRAIRAELPEGNAALDHLTHLSGPAAHSGWTHPNGEVTDEAKAYHKQERVVAQLEMRIRQKWGLPPKEVEETPDKSRRAKPGRSKRPSSGPARGPRTAGRSGPTGRRAR
jgi:hypothetical protein